MADTSGLFCPKALAEQIDKAKSSVSQYCSGIIVPPIDVIAEIAAVLDCEIDDLIDEAEGFGFSEDERPLKILPELAALGMNKSPQFVRNSLQKNRCPFGFGVQLSTNKWDYYISPHKYFEYTGLTLKELLEIKTMKEMDR